MTEPFLAEIKLMAFNFAPRGWAMCNAQTLPINQNQALFALLGTTYGGNGTTNFQLPDLRGRVAIHMGSGYILGQRAGEEAHTLIQSELPQHTHPFPANSAVATATFARYPANTGLINAYSDNSSGSAITLGAASLSSVGGSQPHPNRQPFLTINFCIALQGIFPSQN